jgi:hypothetical protein
MSESVFIHDGYEREFNAQNELLAKDGEDPLTPIEFLGCRLEDAHENLSALIASQTAMERELKRFREREPLVQALLDASWWIRPSGRIDAAAYIEDTLRAARAVRKFDASAVAADGGEAKT